MTRTKEQKAAIRRGLISLVIGILIGIAYLFKFFPMDPNKYIALLGAWAYTGWLWSGLFTLYGLWQAFVVGEL